MSARAVSAPAYCMFDGCWRLAVAGSNRCERHTYRGKGKMKRPVENKPTTAPTLPPFSRVTREEADDNLPF